MTVHSLKLFMIEHHWFFLGLLKKGTIQFLRREARHRKLSDPTLSRQSRLGVTRSTPQRKQQKVCPEKNAQNWHPRRPLHMEMNPQSQRGSFYTREPGFHNFRVTKPVLT